MFVSAINVANVSETVDTELINANNDRIPPELIAERIKAFLVTINEQISNPNQLLNQLIQSNLAKTTPTAASRTHRPQTGTPIKREIEASRASLD